MTINKQTLEQKYYNIERSNKDLININPIQAGGKLTEEAKKSLLEFGDGYSVCDYCDKGLEEIKKPPIREFVEEYLPQFLGIDNTVITHGAREAIFLIFHNMFNKGDNILVDKNRHYTTDLAAELCDLNLITVPNQNHPIYSINVDDFRPLIEKYDPKAVLITYPDGGFGNLPDAKKLGDIVKCYNIPYIINAAYAIGRFPFKANEYHADFVIASGHKSMASAGPVGVLGIKEEWKKLVLRPSTKIKNKIVTTLGCTTRGVPLVTLMASFPSVVERINHWEEELEKTQYFSSKLEELGQGKIVQLGDKPHKHDLMNFETPLFYEISKTHKYRREFLYKSLRKNGIVGIKHGITKNMKASVYGLSYDQINTILSVIENVINRR